MSTKRVNIEVKESIWKQLKIRCSMQDKTLIQAIDEAIRLYLQTRSSKNK